MKIGRMTLLGTTMLCAMVATSWAAPSLQIWHSVESQLREQQNGTQEAPLNVFQRIDLHRLPGNGQVNSYLHYERAIGRSQHDFDIYNLQYDARNTKPWLGMTLGRQTVVRGNYEGLMDGATFRLTPRSGQMRVDLFGGTTRSMEQGDLGGEYGLLTGSSALWKPSADTMLNLTTSYRRDVLRSAAWKSNGTVLVGLNGSQHIGRSRNAMIYVDSAYDVAGKVVPVATLGMQWNPKAEWSLFVDGSRYDANRHRTRQSILSLFTDDDLWQARTGLQFQPKANLSLFTSYDFQQLEDGGATRYSHVVEAGVDAHIKPLKLDTAFVYRLLDSFGGQAHDLLLALTVTPLQWLAFESVTNYTSYGKVTNDNDTALAAALTTVLTPTQYVDVRIGGEYLRNNVFTQEWRFTGMLALRWDALQ